MAIGFVFLFGLIIIATMMVWGLMKIIILATAVPSLNAFLASLDIMVIFTIMLWQWMKSEDKKHNESIS